MRFTDSEKKKCRLIEEEEKWDLKRKEDQVAGANDVFLLGIQRKKEKLRRGRFLRENFKKESRKLEKKKKRTQKRKRREKVRKPENKKGPKG